MGKPKSTTFERLMADPRLAELNELQRGASDALDLIELTENQNSDILAWLFDSREGHGQGDEILRDLLLHACRREMETSCLNPQSMTRQFFTRWTPSKIRTTSFGGAFPVREFGFSKESRTDLAVIDEQNELIVVIENKAKTKHTEGQLNRYREAFEKALKKNTRIGKFAVAFVAMAEAFDDDDVPERPCSTTWLHCGYDWLKASADRAVRQVERGNASARLVASYCTLRTQWEDPLDVKRTRMAASLFRDYPQAIVDLRRLYDPKATAHWFQHTDKADPAMLFVLQNRGTARLLAELKGPEVLAARVEQLLGLEHGVGVEWGNRHVNVRAPGTAHLSVDHYWVAYFNLHESGARSENLGEQRYNVVLVLRLEKFRAQDDTQRIRTRYQAIDKAFAGASSGRLCKAVLAKAQAEGDAMSLLRRHYRALGEDGE